MRPLYNSSSCRISGVISTELVSLQLDGPIWGVGMGEQWGAAVNTYEASLLTTPLMLCGPIPNRPRTSTGLWPGGVDDLCLRAHSSSGLELSQERAIWTSSQGACGCPWGPFGLRSPPVISIYDLYL